MALLFYSIKIRGMPLKVDTKKLVKTHLLFSLDSSGNPVTQQVVGVTDSSGNPVTGLEFIIIAIWHCKNRKHHALLITNIY